MNIAPQNRGMNAGLTLLSGLAVGAMCYLIAEWLTPKQVANPGDHDILLANRLGFIYTPIVGVWLGLTYMVVLNLGIASGMFLSPSIHFDDWTQAYVARMWCDGPLALGLSSALFFVLIRWAIGLTRVRLMVFEETEAQQKED